MLLTLGARTFDLAARALVVGVLTVAGRPLAKVCRDAERLVDDGADLLDVQGDDMGEVRDALAALARAVIVPLGVATAEGTATADAAVASFTGTTAVALETGSVFVARALDRAEAAQGAGLPRERIVLDITPRLQPRRDELAPGYALLTTTCPPCPASEDDRSAVLASAALAVSTGCRLLRTDEPRGVRRVRDVLAAVLAEGRHPG